MENRLTVLALSLILVLMPLSRVACSQQSAADGGSASGIKAEVAKRISTQKTRVKIKLRDGKELKARITQADENGFSVTEGKTGNQIQLAYIDVVSVRGRGMSTVLKIGIVAAVAVAVLAIAVIVSLKNFDPFEGGLRN